MPFSERKVMVQALKDGRWAERWAWLPQVEVSEGDKIPVSVSVAVELEKKGKCRILHDVSVDEFLTDEAEQKYKKKSITKNELLFLLKDVGEDELIWAWWDGIVWPIDGVSFDHTYKADPHELRDGLEDIENCVCIDCPS